MPQTITRTVYTYKELQELHKKGEIKADAVEKAKWKLFEFATDDEFWYESCFEDWKTALKQVGFPEAELHFSGFSSQGDGASFVCKCVDLPVLIRFMSKPREGRDCVDSYIRGSKNLEQDFRDWLVCKVCGVRFDVNYKKLLNVIDHLHAYVESIDHHYSHWNTCRFRLEYDDYQAKHYHPRRTEAFLTMVGELVSSFHENCEQLRMDASKALYKHLEDDYRAHGEDDYLEDYAEANNYTFLRSGKLEME